MLRIWSIAANTFTEVIRQPIYFILLLFFMSLILLSPYFTMFAMLSNQLLIKDMGLATLLLSGLLLAIFSSIRVVHEEMEAHTILTILSKPIRRSSFIIGKYLGLTSAILVAEYLLLMVLLHVVRTEITEAAYSQNDYPVLIGYLVSIVLSLALAAFNNFFYDKSFYSSSIFFALPIFTMCFLLLGLVGQDWTLQPFFNNLDISMVIAAIFIFFAIMLLCAIALAISTRMPPLPTLVITGIIFLLGLFSDYMLGRHVDKNILYKIAYGMIPNLQIYLVNDAVLEERTIPLDYGITILGYTFAYISGILCLAIAMFQNREAE